MTGSAAGSWSSPLDAATVAAAGLRLAQPALHGGWVHWLEGRPSEGGRIALRRRRVAGGPIEDITPAPLSVRSRVHEYGGGAYRACDAGIFFVAEGQGGAGEGQVHWRRPDGATRQLTATPGLRFADFEPDLRRERLLCVIEDGRRDPHRPHNAIAAIALTDGAVTELIAGRDFYASPRLALDGATLAFLTWDLPAMPWDGAELWSVALDVPGAPDAGRRRAGPAAFQPTFAPDGALWCSRDDSGRFLLSALDGTSDGTTRHDGTRECALPLWNLNMRCFGFADAGTVVAASIANGLWQLRALDIATGGWRPLAADLTQIDHLDAADGHVVVLGGGPDAPLGVHLLDPHDGRRETLATSTTLALDPRACAAPEPVVFSDADGTTIHGLWWAPASATHALASSERPPLLLRCHGGPTAAAQSALDARTLYWTTRGFAVLDLNYRGSWGYGRDYRRALDGAWGERDASDAVAAARWAIHEERADPTRIAISGASAGGLTALNALALPAAPFCSAGVHYGLAELISAMTDTHKFESGYGERLLGPWPAARAVYIARSPLTRLAQAGKAPPTILFQGLDDRIVPPDQSRQLATLLRARGGRVALHEYPGEGHGFRRATTIADVLERELEFHLESFALADPAR